MSRKQINLYQAEFRPSKPPLPTRMLLVLAGLFAVLLVGAHLWDRTRLQAQRQAADQVTAQAEAAEQQLEAAAKAMRQADPHVLAEAEALEARAAALGQARDAVASGVLGSQAGYARHFQALARTTVPGAWLTRIDLTHSGREMGLAGRALKGDAPTRLIAALTRQPLFMGMNYAGLNVAPPQVKEGAENNVAYLEFSLQTRVPEGQPATQGGTP